ncbi:MAG: DUF3006 domain-containing protein [Methanocorpusculum sp.]|nr:DUF3006 domain-containing protein [Methanocorpusculum sp.]
MKLLVTVDSIEDGFAALLLRNDSGETPLGVFQASVLPAGTAAGDILSLHFEPEPEETAAAKQRVAELRGRLKGRDRNHL